MSSVEGWLVWVARMTLATTLVVSGASKVRDAGGFARGVREYQILPETLTTPFAFAVIAAEIGLGTALLLNLLPPWPAIGAACLFVLFAVAVFVNLRRELAIACFCMGTSSRERIGNATLVRLLVLIVIALMAAANGTRGGGVFPPAQNLEQRTILVLIAVYAYLILTVISPAGLLLGQVRDIWMAARERKATSIGDGVSPGVGSVVGPPELSS